MLIWVALAFSAAYLCILFVIAWWGDRRADNRPIFMPVSGRAAIVYALTLAIYNTAWSFYGSVGRASAAGYEFLPIYLGPILVLVFARPAFTKVLTISKSQNLTSIADFLGARYGKSQTVAAVVTVMAVIGVLPYIALQLKAVSSSYDVLTGQPATIPASATVFWKDTAFAVALAMAAFTIIFGVRHIHASEHHRGLMLAIAFESLVKLSAFIIVACFIVFGMFDGFGDLYHRAGQNAAISRITTLNFSQASWILETIISAICFCCLPQAFHVAVVENDNPRHLRSALWLYSAYLVILSVFMVPIAIAGLITFAKNVNPDTYVITLPLAANAPAISLIAFIGGVSAATGMVIVAVVSLSTMICNDVIMPLILRFRIIGTAEGFRDISKLLLHARRTCVIGILILAYLMYKLVDERYPLTQIGLVSFVAIAQFGPAFFGGLYWTRASKTAALLGIGVGFLVWFYTLLLPSLGEFSSFFARWNANAVPQMLQPRALFGIEGLDPISHATLWSLLANVVVFITFSFLAKQSTVERVQARAFVHADTAGAPRERPWRALTTLGELRNLAIRFVGEERGGPLFDAYVDSRGPAIRSVYTLAGVADLDAVRFTENLIAGSIGAASARIVMASSLQSHVLSRTAAMAMLDEASEVLSFNRKLLQTALENVLQGICVADAEFRIAAWNPRFLELLDLPADLVRVGLPLSRLIEFNAQRGEYRAEDLKALIVNQNLAAQKWPYVYERRRPDGTVLEIAYSRTPEGGYVATFTDVTERHRAAQALKDANESLELRVRERTEALQRAKADAERANLHKTRFLAVATHDLLQPLNAARLFVTSLEEKLGAKADAVSGPTIENELFLANEASNCLKSAEQLIDGLLDISSLDTGGIRPNIQAFLIGPLLMRLHREFAPLARQRNLELKVVESRLVVESDMRLLRRILQNYLSNALRYTQTGKVVLGCRRRGPLLRIQVLDTGPGIPREKQKEIFEEFRRLDHASSNERGMGLGLSIVDRISALLGHAVTVASTPGRGACFGVDVPVAGSHSILSQHLPEHAVAGTPTLVMCVDNEAAALTGLSALLNSWGYPVVTANSCREAIEIAETQLPGALLLDYHLNGPLSGVELLERLRSGWNRNVHTALVTADRSPEIREEAERSGCNVVYKPIKPALLRRFLIGAELRE